MFGLRAFLRLAISDTNPKNLESMFKQRDLSRAEGPTPVVPQQFVAPKSLIAEADKLELLHQRTFVDEAKKRLLGRLGAGKNPENDIFGYGNGGGTDGC